MGVEGVGHMGSVLPQNSTVQNGNEPPLSQIDALSLLAQEAHSPVEAGNALRALDTIIASPTPTNALALGNNSACRDIYIGGAGDKDSSRIVQRYAERQQQLHPDRDIQYFAYSDWASVIDAASAPLRKGEPLNIIGHSLGGRNAIAIVNARTELKITNLISIDPVGSAGSGSKPSNVDVWANIVAEPSNRDWSDTVASAGRIAFGTTNITGADISRVSPANHGQFATMMSESNALQAIDLSYQKMK